MRNIGRLDKRIEIQPRSFVTRDAFGAANFNDDWGEISICFADVKEIRGDERNIDGKQEAKMLAEFTMRDRDIAAASHRITYDGRVFDVISVKPLSSNRRDGIVVSGEYVEAASTPAMVTLSGFTDADINGSYIFKEVLDIGTPAYRYNKGLRKLLWIPIGDVLHVIDESGFAVNYGFPPSSDSPAVPEGSFIDGITGNTVSGSATYTESS